MNVTFERPSLWQRLKPVLFGFDPALTFAVLLLCGAGRVLM